MSSKENYYEIAFGSDHNFKLRVRRLHQQVESYKLMHAGVLDCNEYKAFWISWINGSISIGKGVDRCQNEVLSWHDPNSFSIKSIGVMTGYGSTGEWLVLSYTVTVVDHCIELTSNNMDSDQSLCNSSEDLFFFKTRNKYPYNSSTYGSSSSGDTFNLKLRNGKLRTAINALTDAFKMVMETIDHLIQKPVDILMAGVDSENSTNRTNLKKSETELQKVAFLLQDGLKRMREAMQEQSRAIKVLSELEQFTPGHSKSPDVEQSSVKSETVSPLSEMDHLSEQQENEQALSEQCKIQNQWEEIQHLLDAGKTNAQTVCNHQRLEQERNSENVEIYNICQKKRTFLVVEIKTPQSSYKTAKYEHPFVSSPFQDEENQTTLENISRNTQKQHFNLVPGKAYRAHGMYVYFR
ncbi:unnamed protein product [Mytilus edulis]|uniref:Farnesoic acid O-methyl transferase domain-containing protein n=1 Tax=Mytilus edulis TaxID=6550 RepID=A0A8S3TKP6_MYTED|nr:unnamed protein product [Mytilus edulis]